MNKIQEKGFGLIEVIIAMAIVAIMCGAGYASYQSHIIKVTENNATNEMVSLMTNYEKFYSQHGSYTKENGEVPDVINQAVIDNNSKLDYTYYKYILHPRFVNSTTQTACITAIPNEKRGISNQLNIITVDNFGKVTLGGKIPSSCDDSGLNPSPDPEPTIIPPTPTPKPTDEPYNPIPVNQCVDENGKILGIPPLEACSGNCEGSALCGTGCSGNCENTFIYKGACSGNCDNSTIWISEPQEFFPICNGNCKNVTVVLPKSWKNNKDIIEKCSNKSGKNQKCLCDTGTGNDKACDGFQVKYQ